MSTEVEFFEFCAHVNKEEPTCHNIPQSCATDDVASVAIFPGGVKKSVAVQKGFTFQCCERLFKKQG